MTENFKMELDVIKDNTNSQNFQITTQNSLSSSNKSNKIDNDITKSMNSFLRKQKLPPLSRNFYSSESEELYSKTKISASSSEIRAKNFPKKMSEQNSFQNQILVVNNSLSPTKKKKVSSFKMVEKSKYKKIFDANDFNARRVEQETITGKERKDAFGNEIKKRNKKKFKVSFIDEIYEDQPLAKIIDIESFKKYNFIVGMPKEEHIEGTHINASNCQCCLIF